MKHPFILLIDSDGDQIEIDREIAPLIQQLWDIGLETCNSCQDNFSYVWVEFLSAQDALDFLYLIVRHGDAALAERASEPYNVSPSNAADQLAKYDACQDSWLIKANVNKYDDAEEVWMSIGIRFPRDHLPRVMAALIDLDN
jgi:hypothetical protein